MTQRLSHLRGSDRVRRINDYNVKGIAHLFLQHVPNEEEEEMGRRWGGREGEWGGCGEDVVKAWRERETWGEVCWDEGRRERKRRGQLYSGEFHCE